MNPSLQIADSNLVVFDCLKIQVQDSSQYIEPSPFAYANFGVYYYSITDGSGKKQEYFEYRENTGLAVILHEFEIKAAGLLESEFWIIPNAVNDGVTEYDKGSLVYFMDDETYYVALDDNAIFNPEDSTLWKKVAVREDSDLYSKIKEYINEYLYSTKWTFSDVVCFKECILKAIQSLKCKLFEQNRTPSGLCSDKEAIAEINAIMAYYQMYKIGLPITEENKEKLRHISNALNQVCCCDCGC